MVLLGSTISSIVYGYNQSSYKAAQCIKIKRRKRKDNNNNKSSVCVCVCVVGLNDIIAADMAHNKVLIAASVSAAIGQLSKPFTSTIIYGKKAKFDIETAFQSGGFPSTHSAAVVATATALGLERGLSDAIFGLAVVYASLIMYDAQGVRREVGVHAKALNEIIAQQSLFARTGNSSSQTTKAYPNSESNFELEGLNLEANSKQSSNMFIANKIVSTSDNTEALSDVEGGESRISVKKLKESVGHSEAEVIAGALLGFLVSLAVCTIIT